LPWTLPTKASEAKSIEVKPNDNILSTNNPKDDAEVSKGDEAVCRKQHDSIGDSPQVYVRLAHPLISKTALYK
jgi:hypothetical protein